MRLLWYVSRRSQPSTASPEVGMAFLISKWARMPMTSQVNGTKNGCIMKNFNKIFFAAVAAAFGLASCSQELTPVEKPQGNLVTVNFGAESSITCPTKATLTTEDEKLFTSAWENGDALSVKYSNDNETNGATTSGVVSATWSTDHFEAQMPEYNGTWDYNVVYPEPDAEGVVDFGSARTQKGNAYNSKYDLMKGSAIAEGADAGKTADGKNIVFNMTRQTAVAYFHLTGTLDEEVVSAKLSVEGGNISSSLVMLLDHTDGFDLSTEDLNEITITFEEGTAPKASDFQLWFNVLPTKYTKMTLAVETTGHTMTISRTAEDMYEAGKLYKVVKAIPADKWVKKGGETPAAASWIATDLADITATDEVVITMAKEGKVYAMTSDNGTKSNPKAVLVTVKDGELTETPANNLVWNIANDKGNLTIYPNGLTDKWLYSAGKTDVKVGNSNTNKIFTLDAETKYLKNTGTSRYLGVYNSQDWRCYTSTSTNIGGQTLCFYVKGTPKTALETPANLQVSAAKVVSWDAVSGAASYELIIGENTFTSETNSYDATAVVDDYYDVAVVAVPSDKENYKNSAAATLSGAKFGTPKLITPELTEGAIDESSIRVNMAVDARATNGCTCEIYNGETLVESKPIKQNYVVFSGLESGVTYTIKINAIAVEGEKPYAASDVASIELKTKATQHVSDVTAAGTYTIKGLTVYAVANASLVVAGDNTGYILVYKSSHGLKVGTTFNVAGTVKNYNGVWEFDSPSITGKAVGETPVYPEAIEADEAYLASYGTATKIEYVHAKGTQNGRNIKVGAQTLYMSAENPETDGKPVEVSGFVYGYNTKFSSASFVATSIQLDSSIPFLSVDQTSKTWAADATDAFMVKVTVNSEGGDWTVTPETLSWATIAVDKTAGTITVTPNGANETETANEAVLTVAHASDASLTKEITLKQNAAGTVMEKNETITLANGKFSNKTITWSGTSCSFVQEKGSNSGAADPSSNYVAKPRWYKDNVITFKANAGYKITKAVVTCTTSDYAKALQGSTYSPAETTSATVQNAAVTITTVGDFTITMGAKAFISSVVVYYTE